MIAAIFGLAGVTGVHQAGQQFADLRRHREVQIMRSHTGNTP